MCARRTRHPFAYTDDAEMLASQQITLVELKMMFALADLDRARDWIGSDSCRSRTVGVKPGCKTDHQIIESIALFLLKYVLPYLRLAEHPQLPVLVHPSPAPTTTAHCS